MARIGIVTCSNCTRDLDCASVVCLADMRKRRGVFERYPREEPLELVGIITFLHVDWTVSGAPITRRGKSNY
ncbi:MAG: CGGC domain-containing protein [Peptococcaceae bacterium]|nr:CGGC domain-containing protein [Peptococcaceae bacterium]